MKRLTIPLWLILTLILALHLDLGYADGNWRSSGGGGAGNPGGTNGQVQVNNNGVFGGVTISGDCAMAVGGGFTCTKTNGTSFGALSTVTPGTGVATALAINIGLAGAPVIFNGALGTPSSGTATNITGLPLTTGVTGILAPANGGTGVANGSNNTITFTGNYTWGITLTGNRAITLSSDGTVMTDQNTSTFSPPALGGILWWSSTSSNGNANNAVINGPVCGNGTSAPAACVNLADAVYQTASSTGTFTNKRITKRINNAASYTTSVTINSDSYDGYTITAESGNLLFNNPSGTPTAGQSLFIRIKDNGTPSNLTYGTAFRAGTTALPTVTTASKTLYMAFLWNDADSKWDFTGTAGGF